MPEIHTELETEVFGVHSAVPKHADSQQEEMVSQPRSWESAAVVV